VESPHGQATVAILIFQDIVVVPMMIVIPFLAGVSSQSQASLLLVLGRGVGFIILVRTRFLAEMERLYSLGADEVIPEEFETSIEIFSRVMAKYLIPRNEIEDFIAVTRADGYDMFRSLSKESTSFVDLKFHLPDLDISTVRVNEGSTMVGKSIAEIELRKNHGVTILAIRRGHQLLSNPDADTVLKANDLLILVGTPAKLSNLCDLVTCPGDSSPAF